MILLAGGTSESIDLAQELSQDYDLFYIAATEYGKELAKGKIKIKNNQLKFLGQRLDYQEFKKLICKEKINCIIDSTHPFATEVSKNLKKVAEELGIYYLNYNTREKLENNKNILYFNSQKEAAQYLSQKEGKIFLTTGSKELDNWKRIEKERLVIRILPVIESLKKCNILGYKPYQIIAAQGPFSLEENIATINRFQIKYIVFKDTSRLSGRDNKLEAANLTGAIPVIISQPNIYKDFLSSKKEVKERLKQLNV